MISCECGAYLVRYRRIAGTRDWLARCASGHIVRITGKPDQAQAKPPPM